MTAKRGLEPQTALVLADLDGPQARQIADMTPEEARAHIDAFVEKWDLDPKPAVGAVEDFEIPGPRDAPAIPVRLYRPVRPAAPGGLPLIVFFHAGGYVFGNIDSHDGFCRLMVAEAGCLMLSVGYRRSPGHKFPAAHEDCYAATSWAAGLAAEIGADPALIAVAGDSSGGTLAIAVCQMAHARGGPAICHQLLWYPGTAGGPQTESMRALSEGYFLNSGLMKWSMGHYLNDAAKLEDPLIAPMRMDDVSMMPPTWLMTAGLMTAGLMTAGLMTAGLMTAGLMTAGFDPRRDDNAAFVERLRAAGVDATYRVLEPTIHGFMFMLGGIDLAVAGAKDSAAYVRAALASR